MITLAADVFFVDGTAFLFPFNGCKKDKIRDGGTCSRQDRDEPKQTSQTSFKGVRTRRICSKNCFNGRGV